MTEGGIFPAIFGTAFLVILMTLAVVPLGVSTAIYLQEYAPKKSRWVPLVRHGHSKPGRACRPSFSASSGSGFFINFIGRGLDAFFFDDKLYFGQPAILWAALTLALLTLPTVVVATEEALRVVPRAHREVAYSLGATRWQMVRYVLLPQAVGGILTGTILAISRGAGEVAPDSFHRRGLLPCRTCRRGSTTSSWSSATTSTSWPPSPRTWTRRFPFSTPRCSSCSC
jgi:phosphate transport system permease protein